VNGKKFPDISICLRIRAQSFFSNTERNVGHVPTNWKEFEVHQKTDFHCQSDPETYPEPMASRFSCL